VAVKGPLTHIYNMSINSGTFPKLFKVARVKPLYKKVLKEAKKRENDRLIEKSSNKMKKIWQIINKQVGKCSTTNKKIELMTATGTETNPQKVAELLNVHFVETVDEIIKQIKHPPHTQTAQSKIDIVQIQ
jgi:hypothetical protein